MLANRIALAAAVFLTTATAANAAPAKTSLDVDAACAGDTITGTVTLQAPAGETYRLDLLYRSRGRVAWTATGRSMTFRTDGTRRSYAYSFDVSRFDAFAYRVELAGGAWSRTIPAASCAPGRQVPEAPYVILLPLSLIATSMLFLRRRPRVH